GKSRNAIAIPDAATKAYPKIGLREKTGMISDIMPKAGSTIMYTSGCPNDQKKCCQSTADPPAAGWKKWALSWRSISNITIEAFSAGSAPRMMKELTTDIHTKSGSLRNVM